MTLVSLPFRWQAFPAIILYIIAAVSFLSQEAKAEESGKYHSSSTGEAQKEFLLGPDLELQRLDNLITLHGDNAEYLYNRGWLYGYLKKNKEAEEDYSRAIEIDKGHADAYYNRGLIYLETKRYDLAIKDFSEVIKINPGAADAFCNRGNAYLAKGKTENALKDFASAIKIAPKDPDLYYNRALLYLSEGNETKGNEDMRAAATLGHVHAREYLQKSGDKL
jgi:tetratricopeptide (TPR) repeat protein